MKTMWRKLGKLDRENANAMSIINMKVTNTRQGDIGGNRRKGERRGTATATATATATGIGRGYMI